MLIARGADLNKPYRLKQTKKQNKTKQNKTEQSQEGANKETILILRDQKNIVSFSLTFFLSFVVTPQTRDDFHRLQNCYLTKYKGKIGKSQGYKL